MTILKSSTKLVIQKFSKIGRDAAVPPVDKIGADAPLQR